MSGFHDNFFLFTSIRYDAGLQQARVPDSEHDSWNWSSSNKSSFYMLDYHRDRILSAARYWQWENAINVLAGEEGLAALARTAQEAIKSHEDARADVCEDTPRRVKIVVNEQGHISFEIHLTAPVHQENLLPLRLPPPGAKPGKGEPRPVPRWTVLLDNVHTAPSEYTHYKTTQRAAYDSALQRRALSNADEKEVLLIDRDDGTVMEGTRTTPYFWREGRWVTPPISSKNSRLGRFVGGQDGTTRRWALETGLVVEQPVEVDSLRHGEECWISNGVRGFIAGRLCLE